jgi:hypothetical protein
MGWPAHQCPPRIDVGDADGGRVADAHACGYVHGGLSPDSVVITAKGHAKIPAFALASRDGFARPATPRCTITIRRKKRAV